MDFGFDSTKLMNRFFRKVDGVVWDLLSGNVGVRTNEGIASLTEEIEEVPSTKAGKIVPGTISYGVTINPMESMGFPLPAFAQNTPASSVKPGDLISGAKGLMGWVTDIKPKSYSIMKADGTITNWFPPKVQFFGPESGIMVVRSLTNLMGGSKDGVANLGNMLLPMLMMNEGKIDSSMEKMLPLMLFGGIGGMTGAGSTAGGMNNMMPMLMMMSMMKGGKSF
jgi:hypothetical protein